MLITFVDRNGTEFVRNTCLIDKVVSMSPRKTVICFYYGYREAAETITVPLGIKTVVKRLNSVEWQDENRTWTSVEHVYETRWDCLTVPEGVRLKLTA